MSSEDKGKNSPYVGIAGVIGGITIAMIAMILIFAENDEWIIVPVVLFMSLFGTMLGYFASKAGE